MIELKHSDTLTAQEPTITSKFQGRHPTCWHSLSLALVLDLLLFPGGWACRTRPPRSWWTYTGWTPCTWAFGRTNVTLGNWGPVPAHVCVGRWGQRGGWEESSDPPPKEAPGALSVPHGAMKVDEGAVLVEICEM